MGPGRCSSTARSIGGLGATDIVPASARPSERVSVTRVYILLLENYSFEEGESQYTRTETLNTYKGLYTH